MLEDISSDNDVPWLAGTQSTCTYLETTCQQCHSVVQSDWLFCQGIEESPLTHYSLQIPDPFAQWIHSQAPFMSTPFGTIHPQRTSQAEAPENLATRQSVVPRITRMEMPSSFSLSQTDTRSAALSNVSRDNQSSGMMTTTQSQRRNDSVATSSNNTQFLRSPLQPSAQVNGRSSSNARTNNRHKPSSSSATRVHYISNTNNFYDDDTQLSQSSTQPLFASPHARDAQSFINSDSMQSTKSPTSLALAEEIQENEMAKKNKWPLPRPTNASSFKGEYSVAATTKQSHRQPTRPTRHSQSAPSSSRAPIFQNGGDESEDYDGWSDDDITTQDDLKPDPDLLAKHNGKAAIPSYEHELDKGGKVFEEDKLSRASWSVSDTSTPPSEPGTPPPPRRQRRAAALAAAYVYQQPFESIVGPNGVPSFRMSRRQDTITTTVSTTTAEYVDINGAGHSSAVENHAKIMNGRDEIRGEHEGATHNDDAVEDGSNIYIGDITGVGRGVSSTPFNDATELHRNDKITRAEGDESPAAFNDSLQQHLPDLPTQHIPHNASDAGNRIKDDHCDSSDADRENQRAGFNDSKEERTTVVSTDPVRPSRLLTVEASFTISSDSNGGAPTRPTPSPTPATATPASSAASTQAKEKRLTKVIKKSTIFRIDGLPRNTTREHFREMFRALGATRTHLFMVGGEASYGVAGIPASVLRGFESRMGEGVYLGISRLSYREAKDDEVPPVSASNPGSGSGTGLQCSNNRTERGSSSTGGDSSGTPATLGNESSSMASSLSRPHTNTQMNMHTVSAGTQVTTAIHTRTGTSSAINNGDKNKRKTNWELESYTNEGADDVRPEDLRRPGAQ
ncbi:hypothetical protein SeLEV6574_g06423 [Synchytrium endobioticum]|uniref:RRM domain-containing protein n=1 Tax=Synchytrium endobioticum TaxID=286115 RepID=A0A507CNQ6_9FUNG|nr:hypothetical protein SeLEV6574_g06423 [Synchytrium endobioticum]